MSKIQFIEKIIDIMKNNSLTELTIENEKESLYIKSDNFIPNINVKKEENAIKSNDTEEKEQSQKKALIPIVSDMIGVLFLKPSPDAQPFVKVGDKVEKGTQVCIIETIKLMNKIVSDVKGTIKEICIENAKPVEYGQTIMYIEQEQDNV